MLITICRLITASVWPLQRNGGVLRVHLPVKFKLLWKSQLEGRRTQAKCEFSDCFAKTSFSIRVCEYRPSLRDDLVLAYSNWTEGVLQHQTNITQLEEKWLFLWGSCNKLCWPSTESFPSTVCRNTHWSKWKFRSPDLKAINAASVNASYWIQLLCYKLACFNCRLYFY